MLNKNGMRPAFATANAQGFSNADRARMNGHISFSESQPEADDFNAFGSAPQKQKAAPQRPQPTKQRPPKQKKPPVKIPVKAILAACGIIAAIILIIVIAVAIFSAPKKEIRIEDNAYFSYVETTEAGDVTRVVSNGKVIKQAFSGKVEIVPAADYSFAYIVEEVAADEEGGRDAGFYMYILKGNNLKEIDACADEMPQLAMLEPGLVYKQGSVYYYHSTDDSSPITANEADNFIISNDAKIVVYREVSKTTGEPVLKYFKNGASHVIFSHDLTPVALSNDGKYVFATNYAQLGYFEIKKSDDAEVEPKMMFSSNDTSAFQGIGGISTSGKEIVFYAKSNGKLMSYLYTIAAKGTLTEIGEGKYVPISADNGVVCPDTFVNSYFERILDVTIPEIDIDEEIDEEDVEEQEEDTNDTELFVPTVATYFFDKNGARHVADASGQFSPDMKYFYYIDEAFNLVKVPLNSDDFKKDAKTILNSVSNFKVIEKGNLYVMHTNPENKNGKIYFVDASTGKKPSIADKVDLESVQYCANSIYFSITSEDVATIYVSTNGSAKEVATFKSGTPTETPVIKIGANGMGESAYAYFVDANGSVKLYYTSNGKKFSLVAQNCTIADFEASLPSVPSTDNTESGSEPTDEE